MTNKLNIRGEKGRNGIRPKLTVKYKYLYVHYMKGYVYVRSSYQDHVKWQYNYSLNIFFAIFYYLKEVEDVICVAGQTAAWQNKKEMRVEKGFWNFIKSKTIKYVTANTTL